MRSLPLSQYETRHASKISTITNMKPTCPTPWLGSRHGYLTDWATQRWVQWTGRTVDLHHDTWLGGPVGKPTGIGKEFFDELAQEKGP